MAIKKQIIIDADTSSAQKGVDDLSDSVKELDKNLEKAGDESEKTIKKTDDAAKKSKKSVSSLSTGFKSLGTAIKATGIGLVVAAVAALTVAFTKNQRVMDKVSEVFETISIVFSKVTDALINVYDSVAQNTENFNGLKAVMLGLLNLAITPLKVAFFGIQLAIQNAQLAWEKSFFGDKDANTIKELNASIKLTEEALFEVGKKAVESASSIVTNFKDAVGEVGAIGTKVGEELSKVSVSAAYEQAQINVQLKNTAQLAVAQQQRLVEQYDRLAEQQRQIRDDNSKSIEERIIANEKLAGVLEKQEKALLAGAGAQIAAAQAELNKNNTIENQVALTEALANKEGILAQVEGFRSEQLVNRIALKKEEIDLDNSISDAEKQRQLDKLDFEAELATTEEGKNAKLQERLDLENEILLEDLARKKELYAEGTQARVDAEQEFADKKQELDQNQILLNNKIIADTKAADDKADADKIKDAELVEQTKYKLADKTFQTIGLLAEENSKLGKATAAAQALVNTYQGITAELATKTATPFGFALKIANIAATTAIGFKAVKDILSTSASSSTSAPSGGGTGGATAPSFNLVAGSGTNQIAEGISQQPTPLRAFVVSSEVTTAQSLDRNIEENASF